MESENNSNKWFWLKLIATVGILTEIIIKIFF